MLYRGSSVIPVFLVLCIRYLRTACRVVASDVVDISDRQYHMEEVLKIAKTERGIVYGAVGLTLLHSQRPKLYGVLAVLSAIGLKEGLNGGLVD